MTTEDNYLVRLKVRRDFYTSKISPTFCKFVGGVSSLLWQKGETIPYVGDAVSIGKSITSDLSLVIKNLGSFMHFYHPIIKDLL